MTGLAIFRLPHASEVTCVRQVKGTPEELRSCQELNGRSGFVVAPFEVTPSQPILLIHPDYTETMAVDDVMHIPDMPSSEGSSVCTNVSGSRGTYAIDFANFHSQLSLGFFQKIVLARCTDVKVDKPLPPLELFRRACMRYPRMFIALVWTEKSGCWLTATPEILLEGVGNHWRTIALAGTMQLEGEQLSGEGETITWSTKNIQEQRIVATYITECLEQFTNDFHEEGPCTVRAANLVHLRSDFTFSLSDNGHIGDLLHALHPTPAVCGLPKRAAHHFIIHNEYASRRYYSGFMGMLGTEETHLYVSLRCMNIEGGLYHLYAGGGLLKDSSEEMEWQETEAKLQTMRKILEK